MNYSHSSILPNFLARYSVYSEPNQLFKHYEDKNYCFFIVASFVNDKFVRSGNLQGIETSHGYMFNRHHYLGAGVGAFFLPLDNVPAFGRVFAEYNAYIKEKGSTPTAGVKLGFCHALNYNNDCKFRNAAEIEPALGWSWTLKSGKGLLLGLSYPFYVTSKPETKVSIYGMPKISFGIEF